MDATASISTRPGVEMDMTEPLRIDIVSDVV